MRLVRRIAVPSAVVLAAATVADLLIPTYPTYDTYANLVWGKALASGMTPDVTEKFSPTPHPLEIALGALVSPFASGDRITVVLVIACFAAFLAGMFAFADATVGRLPAIITTLLLLVNPTLLQLTATAGADVPFLASVAWALAVEARHPGEKPRTVLVFLTLGGLLRPEAWGLAFLYLALQFWRQRRVQVQLLALACLAPALWVALDIALTGDPLHSLTWTTALADTLGRSRSVTEAPVLFVKALAHLVTLPVLALAALGGGMLFHKRRALPSLLPIGLFAVGTLAYLLIVASGFSAVDRYAWLAALPLALAAGYALGGSAAEEDQRLRRRWQRLSVAAVVVGGVGLVLHHPNVDQVDRTLVREPRIHRQYADLLRRRVVRDGTRCGPVTVDGYYRIYEARWALQQPAARVQAPPSRPAQGGVLFSTRTNLRELPKRQQADFPLFLPGQRVTRVTVPGLSAYVACPQTS